jgi:hypothetical protein
MVSGGLGFAISSALTGACSSSKLVVCFAYSVRITDYNPQHANIVLDPYTFFSLIPESGGGALSYTDFFVVSNYTSGSNNVILQTYSPIVLQYNKPMTIVVASSKALDGIPFSSTTLQGLGNVASGTSMPAFLISHGCEAVGQTTCLVPSSNYGQNSPYVTTLFY